MVNTTTPTPSLNNDSPATFASNAGGISIVLKIPRTATGSVGLIKEPNTSAHINGSDKPNRPSTSHKAVPITNVEIRMPTVANVKIVHLRSAMAMKSTCNAPAKSRKLNIPCITVS